MRDVLDRFYTSDALATACVQTLYLPSSGIVIEPSVGGGAFARAIRAIRPTLMIVGVDVDPDATGFADVGLPINDDWLSAAAMLGPGAGAAWAVIGNPPYRHAEEHVRAAIDVVVPGGTVAMLLRLGFLAGQARAALWRQYPPSSVHVLSRRPSFSADGRTDGTEYGWFVWDQLHNEHRSVVPEISWLDWSPHAVAAK